MTPEGGSRSKIIEYANEYPQTEGASMAVCENCNYIYDYGNANVRDYSNYIDILRDNIPVIISVRVIRNN